MPRSRNIKPAFFDNEHLGSEHPNVRLLYIALWTLADREGVVELRPAKIKKYAFGYSDVSEKELNGYLTVLSRLDSGSMLSIVSMNNVNYIVLHNFKKHQNPHHTEKKGDLPELESLMEAKKEIETVKEPLSNGYNPADSLLLIPDSLNTDSRSQEDERKKELENEFNEFWKLYPSHKRPKGSKQDALDKFLNSRKISSFDEIIKGLNAYKAMLIKTDQSSQDAFRWLSKKRWLEDYSVSTQQEKPKVSTNRQSYDRKAELFS